tara:strand:- start:16011 stop:18050 length:2040 start_codon:yes stop_codon:yes gene_type:complete
MAATGDNSTLKSGLRRQLVSSFVDNFSTYSTNKYFLTIGKVDGWTAGQTFDSIPDTRLNDTEFWRNIVGIKQIDFNSAYYMATKYVWTNGTIYDEYDDGSDMSNKKYYVMNNNYDVYKCISNNGNQSSSSEPTGVNTNKTINTSDGYIWKYLFTIPEPHRYYIDDDYIPISIAQNKGTSSQSKNQWEVQKNAVDGAIDFIKITTTNSNYNSDLILPNKTTGNDKTIVRGNAIAGATAIQLSSAHAQSTNAYNGLVINIVSGDGSGQRRLIAGYTGDSTNTVVFDTPLTKNVPKNSQYEIAPKVDIYGDGVSAEAFVNLYDYDSDNKSKKQVKEILVTNPGSSYSRADIELSPRSIIRDVADGTSLCVAKAVIGPPGGHGSNVINELNATALLVVVNIDGTESGKFFNSNEVRQYGILKNPIINDTSSEYLDVNGKPFRIAGSEARAKSSTVLEITTTTTGGFLPENLYTAGKFIIGKESKATGEIIDWSPSLNGNHGLLKIKGVQGTFKAPVDSTGTGEGVIEFSQLEDTWEFSGGAGVASVAGFDVVFRNTPPSYSCNWTLGISAPSGLNSGTFPVDIGVTGGIATRGCSSCVQGTALSWTVNNAGTGGDLVVSDVVGSFVTGDSIGSFASASTTSVINTCTPPEIYPQSGELLYMQNMKPILREDEQREQYQIILKF